MSKLIIGAALLSLPVALVSAQPAPGADPPAVGAPPGGARGGALPARGPSLEVSLDLAQRALAACAALNLNVSVVVVDSGGFVKVSLMADSAGSMSPAFSVRKAALALEFKMASGEVAARAAANDESVKARLAANSDLFPAAGAIVLKAGNDIIGALAVSGARSDQDEACAQKALEQVRHRLK